jgi:hypothetical protein
MSSSFAKKSLAVAVGLVLSGLSQAATVHTRAVAPSPPSPAAIAAAAGDSSRLLLRAGIVDPLAQRIEAGSVVEGLADAPAQPRYAIVQFGKAGADARRALEASGVTFLGYVPNNAYYVRLNGADLAGVRSAAGVRWAGAVAPGLKIDPRLWASRRAELKDRGDARYDIEIETFLGEDPAVVTSALRRAVADLDIAHVDADASAPRRVRVSVRAGDIDAALAAASALDAVQFVAPWAEPKLMNAGSIGAIQGNATAACAGTGAVCGPTPLWDHQLFGTGQIVAVADSGLDADEAWFTTLDRGTGTPTTAITPGSSPVPPATGATFANNKVFAYWVQPGATAGDNNRTCRPGAAPTGFHGTHVNGTVAGDAAGTFGANNYVASTPLAANHDLADGMAPNAQLLFQDIGNDTSGCLQINDWPNTLRQANAGGARIHSNSWGGQTFGAYESRDVDVDTVTREKEDLLVVIAAGNDGDLTAAEGCPAANVVGSVCITSIGSPGNAKNALTVGALLHAGTTTLQAFSSRGPTTDGRIKPDIMAPGTSIVSAAGDATITATIQAPVTSTKSGTSMATPTIAGNTALVRQFFTEGFYPRGARNADDALNPSGMVMKAVLINGTRVLDNWPSMDTGWGRAWLDGNLWFANTLAGGDDTRRLRLFERTNASGLATGDSNSYTIANVQAGAELRATLTWYDLPGVPGAAASLVNNLDLEVTGPGGTVYRGNVFAAGVSTTGGAADAVNTVEQVRLAAPAAGSYTFRVIGASVPGNGAELSERQGYALAVSGAFGLPDGPAFAAPTSLAIASNNASGIGVGFAAAGGAQGFQLYRANGTCATAAAGDFRLVATGAAAPLVDDRTTGGFQYAYKVRGVSNDVEGTASACIDVTSADTCSLMPSAFGITGANGRGATCGVTVNWAASQSSCPASSAITYKVLRSDSPAFTAPQTIIANLASPTWTDTGVVNGHPYFYRTVATDAFGNERTSGIVGTTPSGAPGPDPRRYLDDADTKVYAKLEGSWIIADTAAADGTHSYHTGPDGSASPNCAALRTEKLAVTANSVLSYNARYNLESEWDGVVVEISTDDGATWNDLPPAGGYPSTFAQTGSPPGNLCGYAATHGAFNGATTAASNAGPNETPPANVVFKPFTSSLAAYAGQNVIVRWRVSSDANTDFGGFWLDTVRIGDADIVFDDGFETSNYVCH